MKWVEMIRVRSTSDGITSLYSGLSQEISKLREKSEIEDVVLLVHALYVGDLALILLWKGSGKPKKSSAGISLAKSFEEYGTVEHAVWMIVAEGLNNNSPAEKK